MKILLLSDANSPHTIRWVKSLTRLGYKILIFSIHKPNKDLYLGINNVEIMSLNLSTKMQLKGETSYSKLIYITGIYRVKTMIKKFKPDILHSHYASSYGFIGACCGFNPYIISVWGGDVFTFPKNSKIHKIILKYNFSKADKILSTSRIMKEEIKKYTSKDVFITPFGVDTEKFVSKQVKSYFQDNEIVIGTIKSLEQRYGVEYLIRGFKILKTKYPSKPLKLLIVGDGTLMNHLKQLTKSLDLEEDTVFVGYISNENVSHFFNMLDIYVAMSEQESFGVAVLEASACSKPVIVSNVGGLPEVVDEGVTGFLVETKNAVSLAEALSKLVDDPALRAHLGNNGRLKVINEYSLSHAANIMDSIYRAALT